MRALISSLVAASAFALAPAAMAATVVGNTTTFTPADTTNFSVAGNISSGPVVAAFKHIGSGVGTFVDLYQFTIDQTGLGSGTMTSGTVSPGSSVDTDLLSVFVNGTPATMTTNSDGSVTWSATGVPILSGVLNTISVTYFSRGLFSYGGNATFIPTPSQSAVPEPATWAMMLLGFAIVGGVMRRKKAADVAPSRVRFNFA